MTITLYCILSFLFGVSLSAIVLTQRFAKREKDFIKLQARFEASDELQEIVKRDFVQLANEAIKKEQEDLRKQNREALEEKISPLAKELTEFKDKVDKFNLKGVENTAKIVEQISILEKNNKTIEQEAKNLTEALTKNQNVKGAYGEEILDTILQNSGMQEGIHYLKQYSSKQRKLGNFLLCMKKK